MRSGVGLWKARREPAAIQGVCRSGDVSEPLLDGFVLSLLLHPSVLKPRFYLKEDNYKYLTATNAFDL